MKTSTYFLKRYLEAKAKYPQTTILFRCGDFYELYMEDARVMSALVGLTLTTRNKSGESPIPMCGFPFHQLAGYVAKMERHGHRIHVKEQQ